MPGCQPVQPSAGKGCYHWRFRGDFRASLYSCQNFTQGTGKNLRVWSHFCFYAVKTSKHQDITTFETTCFVILMLRFYCVNNKKPTNQPKGIRTVFCQNCNLTMQMG